MMAKSRRRAAVAVFVLTVLANMSAARAEPDATQPPHATTSDDAVVDRSGSPSPSISNPHPPSVGASKTESGGPSPDDADTVTENEPAPPVAQDTAAPSAADAGASNASGPEPMATQAPADAAPSGVSPAADAATEVAPGRKAEEQAPAAQPRAEPDEQEKALRPADITLTVATWQSAYSAAQMRTLFTPFRADHDYRLEVVTHGGRLSDLDAARVEAAGWTLIEVDEQTARRGCRAGWLNEIDVTTLPPSVEGDPARMDYLPGAVLPCAVGSAAWSAALVHDSRAAFPEPPESVADVFDLKGFPGMRALPRQAPYLLELALMADGVSPAQVYDVLQTQAGQDRAFSKLSSIRHAIVWWDDAANALAPFSAGAPESVDAVVMGLAFNGRIFTSAVRTTPFLRILWDGQVYRFNYWAVPSSAPHAQASQTLLKYVSLPERQARLTRWFPYGPTRRSALPLVDRHAEIDVDMGDFVPTMPANMRRALRFDQAWWSAHGEPIKTRFAAWLALPTPQVPPDQLVPPTPVRALRARATTVQ